MPVDTELSFIIVNWNGGEMLRRCLDSIRTFGPTLDYEVILIDNASTDDSIESLKSPEATELRDSIQLRLIENTENMGFARANNQAFKLSRSRSLFLLNPDSELTPGACDRLLKTLSSDSRIGACGPRLLNPDGSVQISVWRNPPTAWATLLSGLRLASLLPRRLRGELLLGEHWHHNTRRDVSMLGGAAILVRREVIDEVGGFDENFHMYGEDGDWCLRIKRAGWRLVFEPEAVVIHQGGHGSLQRWSKLEKLRVQSEAYVRQLRQGLPRWRVVTNLSASSFLLALQYAARRLRGRPVDEVSVILGLHFGGLLNAFKPASTAKDHNQKNARAL